jgi:hypothetical protein
MRRLVALTLLALLAACSKPASGSTSTSSSNQTTTVTSTTAPAGSACDRKLVTVADMAGLVPGTPTMGPLEGDPQSCLFTSGQSQLTVSLRPGLGDATVQTVLSGGENVQATPVAGVGDKAAWTAELHEINATKNNVLCDVQPSGFPAPLTQQQLGDLCNKIFSRM